MSNRGLNSETTNLYVWRKDSKAGFYSRVLIFRLSSRIHTHTHKPLSCQLSHQVMLWYRFPHFSSASSIIKNTHTHTHHLLILTYHVISFLKPKAKQGWEVRCLIALIHVYNGCGRKYISREGTHLTHISLKLWIYMVIQQYTHSMTIMCAHLFFKKPHIRTNILLFRVCSFPNSILPALVHSYFLYCHWMKL